jgi:hypothetical protein
VTVAENTAEMDALATLAATNWGAPATGPGVKEVAARPSAPVVADGVPRLPPPWVTVNVTVAPLTGFPCASSTSTTSGCGSSWPAIPIWPSPESF